MVRNCCPSAEQTMKTMNKCSLVHGHDARYHAPLCGSRTMGTLLASFLTDAPHEIVRYLMANTPYLLLLYTSLSKAHCKNESTDIRRCSCCTNCHTFSVSLRDAARISSIQYVPLHRLKRSQEASNYLGHVKVWSVTCRPQVELKQCVKNVACQL